MAFDGSGNYVPASPPNFPAISGAVISSTYFNATINELCTSGLSQTLTRDGQGKPSGPISWNNQNLSGVNILTSLTGNITTANITTLNLTNPIGITIGGTGVITAPANGQLLIGNGAGYTLGTITSGTGITVTNSAGGITIAVASGGGTVISVGGGTTGLIFTGTTALTMSGTLAVLSGGTGGTTSTGTGAVVLATNPTLVGVPLAPTAATSTNTTQLATTAYVKAQLYATLANPAITGGTIDGNKIGYLDLAGTTNAGTYTLALADRGQTLFQGGNLTIPANASVAFPIRTAITIIATAAITIAITTDTLTLAGTATTGTRTLAANSIVTLVKISATAWLIGGSGVS